jgi:uncharacterized membrane protein
MENAHIFLEYIILFLEFIGVIVIFWGVIFWVIRGIINMRLSKKHIYTHIREEIGRAILLGLEILIAVDIIKTVTTELTLASVTNLAIIVLIRTFLSISLGVEIERKFPWQKDEK